MKLSKLKAYCPADYTDADVMAIQALAKGEAQPHQQIRALKWIVEECARAYDCTYKPESDRDTAFAEGRRFVALQIIKLTKLNLAILKKEIK